MTKADIIAAPTPYDLVVVRPADMFRMAVIQTGDLRTTAVHGLQNNVVRCSLAQGAEDLQLLVLCLVDNGLFRDLTHVCLPAEHLTDEYEELRILSKHDPSYSAIWRI